MAKLRHWNMKTASSSSVIMPAADFSRLMLSRPHMTMLQVMKPTCNRQPVTQDPQQHWLASPCQDRLSCMLSRTLLTLHSPD